ncbi:ABC transporter permease subunit [Pseudohoeflea coraliihabitans]|uniref:ATP-binding cassette domain-containing protein n=1 Tax=Pseudohoeflea coraliihabitans TaxID=2860393 RepID=A0ABS6WK37_9HYPH|nr:ATP-binding cassette domain-containing protein [Pseudohoeflea sp. DP4N28-3]MBW3096018.1 ATP-binding cassette domain-containing protein [Pseudohoeflea sp. DP4N28-3]
MLMLAGIAAMMLPTVIVGDYMTGLLVQALLFGMVALLTDIIWGYAGILTFASAAMFGVGAYFMGGAFVHFASTPGSAFLAVIAASACAFITSAAIGWLAFYSRIRVSEFYIAIVTLGVSVLMGQAILYGGALTGGSNGLSGFATFAALNQHWYGFVAALFLALLYVSTRVVRSDYGLVLKAIRDNEVRCRYLGIDTPLVRTVVFSVANAAIAVVGAVYAMFTTVVAPSLVSMAAATNVLIWVILGGRGTLIGPALAAILITTLTPQLSTAFPLYWQGFLGAIFVLIVVFLPQGLMPFAIERAKRSFQSAAHKRPVDRTRQTAAETYFTRTNNPNGISNAGSVAKLINVSKRFGSFQACNDVSFSVDRGELVSIVGPNGAGKTSLVRCIADGDERSSGSVEIAGISIGREAPEKVVALGVGRKFQSPSIFGSLTVRDCLQVASWRGKAPSWWRRDAEVRLPDGAADVVEALGLDEVWDQLARDISHGQRQALELAMVLALEPSVLILDEPTAGLSTAERERVGEVLLSLVASRRMVVLLIEHDFEFVKRISSRIVVLVGGELVADGTVSQVANSEIVKRAYLGKSHEKEIK